MPPTAVALKCEAEQWTAGRISLSTFLGRIGY